MTTNSTAENRQVLMVKFLREEKAKLTPYMPNRLTGQQIAYAKGRAIKRVFQILP